MMVLHVLLVTVGDYSRLHLLHGVLLMNSSLTGQNLY